MDFGFTLIKSGRGRNIPGAEGFRMPDFGFPDGCAMRHTTGEARSGSREGVTISSLFFGCGCRIDGWRGAGRRLSVRNSAGGRPVDRFYADDFEAGRGFGPLHARRADRSHGAAVEFLAGVFGGALQANLVAVEAGQDAFRADVAHGYVGEASGVESEIFPAGVAELFVAEVV